MNEKQEAVQSRMARAQLAQAPMERLRADATAHNIPERPASAVVVELALEREELCRKIDLLKMAIEADPEQVSERHKSLWRDQLEAMKSYETVLAKRIVDLMGFDV